jgi:hypothetical protein
MIWMKLFALPILIGMTAAGAMGMGFGHAPYQKITRENTMAAGLGIARNLTAFLEGKGNDVTSLETVLAQAQQAIQDGNTTAYRSAMRTFSQDLQARVRSGAIDPAVIRSFATEQGNIPDQGPGTRVDRFRTPLPAIRHGPFLNCTCSRTAAA